MCNSQEKVSLSKFNEDILNDNVKNKNEKNDFDTKSKNNSNKSNDNTFSIDEGSKLNYDVVSPVNTNENYKKDDPNFNTSEIVAMISFYVITLLIIIITMLFINQKL